MYHITYHWNVISENILVTGYAEYHVGMWNSFTGATSLSLVFGENTGYWSHHPIETAINPLQSNMKLAILYEMCNCVWSVYDGQSQTFVTFSCIVYLTHLYCIWICQSLSGICARILCCLACSFNLYPSYECKTQEVYKQRGNES